MMLIVFWGQWLGLSSYDVDLCILEFCYGKVSLLLTLRCLFHENIYGIHLQIHFLNIKIGKENPSSFQLMDTKLLMVCYGFSSILTVRAELSVEDKGRREEQNN
ncbi:hypothetical protein S245_007812 [Arachis hypogaea]